MTLSKVRGLGFVLATSSVLWLAGCASDGTPEGPAAGTDCAGIKSQLNALDAKGVQAYVEALSRGKKLPPAQKAQADNYNKLLNDYLGAHCHVAQ